MLRIFLNKLMNPSLLGCRSGAGSHRCYVPPTFMASTCTIFFLFFAQYIIRKLPNAKQTIPNSTRYVVSKKCVKTIIYYWHWHCWSNVTPSSAREVTAAPSLWESLFNYSRLSVLTLSHASSSRSWTSRLIFYMSIIFASRFISSTCHQTGYQEPSFFFCIRKKKVYVLLFASYYVTTHKAQVHAYICTAAPREWEEKK